MDDSSDASARPAAAGDGEPEVEEAAAPTRSSRRRWFAIIGAGLGLAALNVAVFFAPVDWSKLGEFSYVGVFLLTFVANLTIVIPIPWIPVVARVATEVDQPWLVVVLAAAGSTLGETSGYLAGRAGQQVAADSRAYAWVQRQLAHPVRAFGALMLMAAPPNPSFDIAGIAAGAFGLRYLRFLAPVFCGRLIRMMIVVWAGALFV